MSFDPQNPRGTAPQPPAPSTPPTPTYVPPQPVGRRPPPVMVIGPILVGILVVVAVALYLISNNGSAKETPAPTSSEAAVVVPTQPATSAGAPVSTGVQPTTNGSLLPPTPVGSPSTAYEAFLLHVPADIRASCVQGSSSNPQIQLTTSCTTSGGITVAYSEYDTADDMNADYQTAFKAVEIDANSGSCEDVETWPAESSYDVEGTLAGRRLCLDQSGVPTIIWTYDALAILSTAQTTGDPAALVDFWTNEAGPIA